MSDKIIISNEFKKWVTQISDRYKNSQIKAAISVNKELLSFYFELGKEISTTSYKYTYGGKFYNNLSNELIKELPNIKGLSPRNLRYIESFYNLYKDKISILPQLVAKLFAIPWGHHRYIIDKCKDVNEALFFIDKIYENNWSRSALLNFLGTNLYKRQGNMISNFDNTLPSGDLAKEITKDPYNFDFLEIREDFNEKELKDALINNIQKFLLELGQGFAFVGRENRLLVGNTELYADLLFYHIKLHAYVVIEVKNRKFEPGDLGQLGTYVTAVNHLLRSEQDNETIGLLICKNKDEVVAKYSLEGYNIPVGITSFELSKFMPENFKSSLPSIDEIENEFKDK